MKTKITLFALLACFMILDYTNFKEVSGFYLEIRIVFGLQFLSGVALMFFLWKDLVRRRFKKGYTLQQAINQANEEYEYIAKDKDGFIYYFYDEPEKNKTHWLSKIPGRYNSCSLLIKTKNINWETSLTKRTKYK